MADKARPCLFLILLSPDKTPLADASFCISLGEGVYLLESEKTRSRLYHTIKARCAPRRLLVAPLAGDPKFKGMAPGALAGLRERPGPEGSAG